MSDWHVLGAGAIGCLWAGYWCRDQRPPILIARKPSPGPLILEDHNTLQQWDLPCQSVDQLQAPIHKLLICTKATATQEALNSVRHRLSTDACVVVLQNGLEALDIQLSAGQRLVAASTTDGAFIKSPHRVFHAGRGQTVFGDLSPNFTLEDSRALRSELPTGLDIRACDDIADRLWQKLMINCAINGLTVRHRCRNGELLSRPNAYAQLQALSAEIQQAGRVLAMPDWIEQLSERVEAVLLATAENINSMRQDIEAGRTSEIEALNGVLCRKAREQGLELPLNEALVREISGLSP